MMIIPASNFPRRPGALRREIFLSTLLLGLLATMPVAPLQATEDAGSADFTARTPAAGSAWLKDPQADLAEFGAWAMKFAKAQRIGGPAAAPDAATLATGVRLAERRRMVLSALVQTDPARALSVSVPTIVRDKMPAGVLNRLEIPFSAVGDLSVVDQSGHREITLDDHTYGAHVCDRQLAATSQHNVSLHGFTLDGEAVVDVGVPRVFPAADSSLARVTPLPQVVYGNDAFGNALQLFDNDGSIGDDNIGATKEPGEPNHAGSTGGASVWYVFTPASSGQTNFSTDDGAGGLLVDTLLAVYTGTDVANLFTIASSDDTGNGFNSQVSFYALAGVSYYIAVDGFNYGSSGVSQGSYTLNYSHQGNPLAPLITSDSVIETLVNTSFSYFITATNNPTSFSATGLPFGVNFNPSTGEISGILTTVANYPVTISATNGQGTGTGRLVLSATDHPLHLPFFRTEVVLPQSPGVYYLHLPRGNIFGFYAFLEDENYIYHFDLGYEYTFDANDGKSGIYLYDFASETFFYTSPTFPFPYMYDFKLNAVLYYFPDLFRDGRYNTNGIRYFYNFSTGAIISK